MTNDERGRGSEHPTPNWSGSVRLPFPAFWCLSWTSAGSFLHPLGEEPVAPEEEALVAFAGQVGGEFVLGEGDVEVRERPGVIELEFAFAQPASDGHAEPFFWALDDFAREQRSEGPLQD